MYFYFQNKLKNNIKLHVGRTVFIKKKVLCNEELMSFFTSMPTAFQNRANIFIRMDREECQEYKNHADGTLCALVRSA